jgi:hypothetical protein
LFSFFGFAFVCSAALLSGAGFSSRPTGLAVVVFFLFFHRFSCSSVLIFHFSLCFSDAGIYGCPTGLAVVYR